MKPNQLYDTEIVSKPNHFVVPACKKLVVPEFFWQEPTELIGTSLVGP